MRASTDEYIYPIILQSSSDANKSTSRSRPSVQSGEYILNDNIQDPNLDHTVFVNASNWPSGERKRRNKGMIKFGGLGFQPVVVDLKE